MKRLAALVSLLVSASALFAQWGASGYGKEIPNLVTAVREASPGDYITLPSGKRYVLTAEEIAIARDEFDYGDLSAVPSTPLENGVEMKTISGAHSAYVFADGQEVHVLKTARSFTAYMAGYVERYYYPALYVDFDEVERDARPLGRPDFSVFRAWVEYQMMSNGRDTLESVIVTVYNHDGESYVKHYCEAPGFVWGNIDFRSGSTYSPVGEPHKTETFDLE